MIWPCILFCCAAAALLAGIQSALLAVSRVRVRHAAEVGDKLAGKLAVMLERRNELLKATVVANHVFSIAAFALLTMTLDRWAVKWSIAAASALVLPVFLVLFDLLPKSFFRRYPFRLLKRFIFVLFVLQIIALPWRLLGLLTGKVSSSPSGNSAAASGVPALADNITSLVLLPETAASLLQSFANFRRFTAADLMKPLTKISALPASLPLSSAATIVQQSRQRHHAVLDESGAFSGYFDAAAVPPGAFGGKLVQQFVHPLIRVKTSDAALHCLQALRKASVPMALVLNDEGQTVGLLDSVTLIGALLQERELQPAAAA